MPKIKNIPAIRAAIAVAQKNPEILTGVALARNAKDNFVSTLSPDATCWCILGLVAREAGVDLNTTDDALRLITDDPDDETVNEIYTENDRGIHRGDPLRGVRYLKGLLDDDNQA